MHASVTRKRGYELESGSYGKGTREGDWKELEEKKGGGSDVTMFQFKTYTHKHTYIIKHAHTDAMKQKSAA